MYRKKLKIFIYIAIALSIAVYTFGFRKTILANKGLHDLREKAGILAARVTLNGDFLQGVNFVKVKVGIFRSQKTIRNMY